MYKYGTGVNEDSSQAVFWYKKAAEQGNTKAQLNLATMYASGEGILENFVLAYKWANLAAARGNENAREMKNEVKKRMTRSQIAEAQQLSLEMQQIQSGTENWSGISEYNLIIFFPKYFATPKSRWSSFHKRTRFSLFNFGNFFFSL